MGARQICSRFANRRMVGLAPRQLDCVIWAARGKTDSEIAAILGISHYTVIQYLKLARQRYGVHSRSALIMLVLRDGLLTVDEVAGRYWR